MKSLVFNLLVVGALAFLLFDGDPPQSVSAAVDKVAVKTDQLIDKGKALAGKPAEPRATPAPSVTPKPEPVAAPAAPVEQVAKAPAAGTPLAQPPKPVAKTPSPAKPAKVAAAPAPKLDPAVARRRAEVLGETPDGAATARDAAPRFMTPRVRRTELHKLAEDMELMFVEKVAR